MSSIEELKVIRLYRAYNTVLRMCADRAYEVRHPSAVADALKNPSVYDAEGDGLPYEWFLRHFIVTPADAAAQQQKRSRGSTGGAKRGGNAANEEEGDDAENEEELPLDDDVLEKAKQGEWVAMRNAMRLGCSCPAMETSAATASPRADGGEDSRNTTDAEAGEKKKKKKKKGSSVLVFFSGSSAMNVKEVLEMREKAISKGTSLMIIVANKVPPAVMRDIHELSGRLDSQTGREILRIQVFEEEALSFYAADHETVPHHEALTPAQAQQFLDSRSLNIAQLPRMLSDDPMVRVLGLAPGDIVKITRPSKESGPYDMYRQVV